MGDWAFKLFLLGVVMLAFRGCGAAIDDVSKFTEKYRNCDWVCPMEVK